VALFAAMFLLLAFRNAQISVQTIQSLSPENSIMLNQLGDFLERSRAERAHMAAPFAPLLHKPCSLQIGEVLGNSLLRHVKGLSQLPDGGRPGRQPAKNRPASWVRQGRKSCAQTIHNHMVVHVTRKVNRIFQRLLTWSTAPLFALSIGAQKESAASLRRFDSQSFLW